MWKNTHFHYIDVMKEKELRFRIPAVLFKRYKLICTEMDLSIPKQSKEIIKNFVEVHENNLKLLKDIKQTK